jgi:hypothetical protein
VATNRKPQNRPTIDLSSTGVDVLSPAPNDTDIVMAGDVLSFQLNLSVTSQVMAAADARQRARGGAPPHRERRERHPVHAINGTATSLPAEVPVAIEGERARLRRPREPGRGSRAGDLGR